MDTFAALALATEPPSMALLDQKPYSRAESIVTPVMWRNIFGQAFYQLVIFFLFLFLVPSNIIPWELFFNNDVFSNDTVEKYFLKDENNNFVNSEYGG